MTLLYQGIIIGIIVGGCFGVIVAGFFLGTDGDAGENYDRFR